MKNIYVAALKDHESYHYEFQCSQCKCKMTLCTGQGRYGNLGDFNCPDCNEYYYATIDDHPYPNAHISKYDQQSSSYFRIASLNERDNKM